MAKTTSKPASTKTPATRARSKPAATPAVKSAPKSRAAASKSAKPELATMPAAPKRVRDRFTMLQSDFDRIVALKARSSALGRPAKKNELLRAGLQTLTTLADETLLLLLDQLEPAKPPKRARADKPGKPTRD